MKLPTTLIPSRTKLAFTLTELVVLVVVVGVLVCLLATNALRNSRSVKRAQCASNLRQFGLAIQIYGNENNGRLPPSNVGFWPWDIAWPVGAFVENTGSKWQVMFCPGRSPSYTETDNWQLYNYVPNSFRVIGYTHTLPGGSTLVASNINSTLFPEPIQTAPAVFVRPRASERVLLADATISGVGQNNPALRFSSAYSYVGIPGGYLKSHFSAHLSDRFPAGGNLTMLDGHVEWRKFQDMSPRTAGSSPVFWW